MTTEQKEKRKLYQRTYMKNYYKTENGKDALKKGYKKWVNSPKGKINRRKSAKEYYEKNKEKHRAKYKINYAIRKGRMLRASNFTCQICNDKKAQDYHHYLGHEPEHYLDVIPVCKKCHYTIHH